MRELNTEIEINASAKTVWHLLTDFEAYPQWNPFIRSVEGRPEPNSKLNIFIQPSGGRGLKFYPTVLKAEPQRELRWLGSLFIRGLFDGEHIFVIEPLAKDRVKFAHGEKFSGLLVPLFWRTLDTDTRRGFNEMNVALKNRAENPTKITLSVTTSEDLNELFQFQLDKDANHLAAFTAKNPNDETAYIEKYSKLLADPTINMRTIRANDEIVGSIAKFLIENDAEITYWIDRKFWGQGIATTAVQDFLKLEQFRPIYGRVAFDNYGSQRVLEKCGFVKVGKEKGFANARQAEIEEYIYKLSD